MPTASVKSVNGQFVGVTILGSKYQVSGAIRSALEMYAELHMVLQKRYWYPDGVPPVNQDDPLEPIE